MRTQKRLSTFAVLGLIVAISSCSSLPGSNTETGESLSSQGPTILNPRMQPDTIELNAQLQPMQQVEILADVKDFNSKVNDVRVRFKNVPLEVPMRNVGGTTWRATLTSKQVQMLAVSGKTMEYDASIIAKNEAGEVAMSGEPVKVAVNTPDLAASSG